MANKTDNKSGKPAKKFELKRHIPLMIYGVIVGAIVGVLLYIWYKDWWYMIPAITFGIICGLLMTPSDPKDRKKKPTKGTRYNSKPIKKRK